MVRIFGRESVYVELQRHQEGEEEWRNQAAIRIARSLKLLPMSEMLGEIGNEENAAKRGILTVIVVHKSGDMEPGVAFTN
jgi:DNA polymerase III alpha subunit